MNSLRKMQFICIIFVVLALGVNSLHLLSQQHKRQISKECCKIKGGFECGTTFLDCCAVPKGTPKQKINRDLCVRGGLFNSSEFCPGQIIKEPCNYCQKQCEEKKGAICGLSNGESDQCCAVEDCVPDINFELKMKKCKPGKEIKLTDCVADISLTDEVLGKVESLV